MNVATERAIVLRMSEAECDDLLDALRVANNYANEPDPSIDAAERTIARLIDALEERTY